MGKNLDYISLSLRWSQPPSVNKLLLYRSPFSLGSRFLAAVVPRLPTNALSRHHMQANPTSATAPPIKQTIDLTCLLLGTICGSI